MKLIVLDIPQYLVNNRGKVENVKMLCVFNRQIDYPEHLKQIEKKSEFYAVVVDIIGLDIKGKCCLAYGQCVVLLSSSGFRQDKNLKQIYVLEGNLSRGPYSGVSNHVELTKIYEKGVGYIGYPTKIVLRDYREIVKEYPMLCKSLDYLAHINWDYGKLKEIYKIDNNYRVSCSNDKFIELDESKKFVYKNTFNYKRDRILSAENLQDREEKKLENNNSVSRNVLREKPKKLEDINIKYLKAQNRVNSIVKEIAEIKKDNLEDVKNYLYRQLKKYWKTTSNNSIDTGRSLFKEAISQIYPEYVNKQYKGENFIDALIDKYNLLGIWYTKEIPKQLMDVGMLIDVVNLDIGLNICIIDILLGLKGKLFSTYQIGVSLDLDIYSILLKNPYYLTFVDNRLNIEDLDKIALLFKIDIKKSEIVKIRNSAYLHSYLQDSSNYIVGANTNVLKNDLLKKVCNGRIISGVNYKQLQAFGCIFSSKQIENLKVYISKDITQFDFAFPKDGWIEIYSDGVRKFLLPFKDNFECDSCIKDYLSTGLGVENNINGHNYIMDYALISKEMYIIEKLYRMSTDGLYYNLNEEDINKCIRAFERQKSIENGISDFKLEEKQKDGVRGLSNPVFCITGQAGSGKTTTAEAVLFAIQALLGIEEDEIFFVAPTGRASSRLKEVVKKPTRTIHSLFGIGLENYAVINKENDDKLDMKVLIVDESSMINLDVMYNALLRIDTSTRVIFLGDFEQLPPIGFGKPFVDILKFLPCVYLDVPKRASENSGITRNAQEVLKGDLCNLQSYDDFRIIEVEKERVSDLVVGIINYHLGRAGEKRVGNTKAARRVVQSLGVDLTPDDIQVITPINKYEWGTKELNERIQDVINPCKPFEKTLKLVKFYGINREEYKFRKRDRVIHLENMTYMRRFKEKNNGYQLIEDSSGVMNGDIGKIVNFKKGSELKFLFEDGSENENIQEEFDTSEKTIYIIVKYQDTDLKGNIMDFVCLYPTYLLEDDNNISSDNTISVSCIGNVLLNLAYALTVHKIQGSQAKLVISIFYSIAGDFINKNIIYTAITRAEVGEYLIGNVLDFNNAIQKGVKIDQNNLRRSLCDLMY